MSINKKIENKNILISGASVAGPAIAYWLGQYGFTPTVVELAPSLRSGGYAVDFRGTTHLTVLERMGILDKLRKVQTGGSPANFVDRNGKVLASLPAEFQGGDLEITRSDLSKILYDESKDTTNYIFGDTITSLTETDEGVHVTFKKSPARTFDLIIAADGLHSNVRRLAFGPESKFHKFLGYYVANWDIPNYLNVDRTALYFNTPGKFASVVPNHRDKTRATAFFAFASKQRDYDRHDVNQQKQIIAEVYDGMGWEVPNLIQALQDTPELYFDSISRIDVKHLSKGRVVLLGDAGYSATLGGMGTGMAIVGAYVLAGELASARGNYSIAFQRYEDKIRDYAKQCQKGGRRTGQYLAPPTRTKIQIRNRMLNSRFFTNMMIKQGKKVSTNITLSDYSNLLN